MTTRWWLDVPPEPVTRPKGTFLARYNGRCGRCGGTILRRDVVRFVRRGGVRILQHHSCPSGG